MYLVRNNNKHTFKGNISIYNTMAQEKQFENKIKSFLKNEGVWFVKFWGGNFTRAGVPDLLCCINGQFVAIEVKAENGNLNELQKYTIEEIQKSGGLAFELKPSGFENFKEVIYNIKNK